MAILGRSKPPGTLKKVRESVWPSMGWKRAFHYYRHRVFRTGDSTYKITAGLASGVAASWSPFMGTHFFQAVFLAWLLRANMLAGFIGTAFGNPWTFPFMYWASYKLGVAVCGLFGMADLVALPPAINFAYFLDRPWEFLKFLFGQPSKLLLPLTLGGYLWGLIFWPLSYAVLYYPVRAARAAYQAQKSRRIAQKKAKEKPLP